jgi:hypothetical protein
MQYKKFAFIAVVLMALVSLWSCEYEKIEPPDLPPATDTIHYSTDIQPIWNRGCDGCHGIGMTPPDLTSANSYNALMSGNYVNTADPASSVIYTEMTGSGGMAQYTNTSEANLVLVWIQQGAKNN